MCIDPIVDQVACSIPARSSNIDHEIFSSIIILPSADSFRLFGPVIIFWQKNLQE